MKAQRTTLANQISHSAYLNAKPRNFGGKSLPAKTLNLVTGK